MIARGVLIFMLAFAAGGPGVAAQQGEPDACLGFQQALALATARAPEVSAAEARRDRARADLREARSLRRPQVSTFGRTATGDNGLTSNQLENQVGLQVSQRLFDFGDAGLAEQEATELLGQRQFEIREQQLAVAYTLAEAYLTRLEALEMIEVIDQRRSYFERQRDAVTDLLETGGATRADRAQIEAQLAGADADVLDLRFTADRAFTRVREYTQRQGAVLCPRNMAGNDMERALSGLGTLDRVVAAALHENPQIQARLSSIRSLEAGLSRARRNHLPVIEAVGIVSYVYDDTREDWEGRDRIGVDVSVPLYTGRALDARRDRARADIALEQSALRISQRELREQTEIAFRRQMSLQAQLVRREAVAASQEDYFDAIAGEFDFGLGTLPELIDARLEHERAELDVISARYALLRQKVELLHLTGRLPVASVSGE
jgi:outer membrane protein TolC